MGSGDAGGAPKRPAASSWPATLKDVYAAFGPTHPGHLLENQLQLKSSPLNVSSDGNADQLYALQYPSGLCFVFRVPADYVALYQNAEHMPLELPDGTSPSAVRCVVFHGADIVVSTPMAASQLIWEPVKSVPDGNSGSPPAVQGIRWITVQVQCCSRVTQA